MSLNLERTGWRRVAFGDVIRNVTERVDDPQKAGVDRYVGLEHLDPGVMTVQRWDSPDKVAAQKLRFREGDVIFGRRRAYQKKVAMAKFEGICSAHALVLRADEDSVHPEFLPWFLASKYFLDRAISISVGSLSPTVNWRDLKVQEFDLPPLDEQARIADLMWALEEHRSAVADLQRRLDDAAAAFLGEASEGGSETIRSIADVLIGFAFDSSGFTSEPSGGPRLLRGINIGVGATRWDEKDTVYWAAGVSDRIAKFVLHEGDIVIPMDRPFTAAGDLRWAPISRHDEGGLLVQRVARLRPRLADYRPVVRAVVRSPRFQKSLNGALTGSFAPHLAHGDFARFKFDPERGLAVAKKLLAMEHAEGNAAELATRIATLRSALLADVFGGAA